MYGAFQSGSNPFHATDLFLYTLKTSENLRYSDIYMGYRKTDDVNWVKNVSNQVFFL